MKQYQSLFILVLFSLLSLAFTQANIPPTQSSSLTSDVEVNNDWTRFQTEDDPVIQAAMTWLIEQPSCGE
jgi:hypothetical protein